MFIGETGFWSDVLDDRFHNFLLDYELFLRTGKSRYAGCMLTVLLW